MDRYRIKDWDQYYEKSQTRKCKSASWVSVPNKHDGKSYRRLMRRKDGPQLYCAWVLILQVASKCPVRGVLEDGDGPLTPEDLEAKTDCPAKLFAEALKVLSSDEIGWVLVERYQHATSTLPARWEHAGSVVCPQDRTGQDITEQDKTLEASASCSEPDEPAAEPVLVFSCVGSGDKSWVLTPQQVAVWREAFPHLDVVGECRKALAWLDANPTKRKTSRGMRKFLYGWLERSQNRNRAGPNNGRATGATHSVTDTLKRLGKA